MTAELIERVISYFGAHPELVLYTAGGVWALGWILGASGNIVVFRDYYDVGFVGLTVTVPIAIMMWLIGKGADSVDFMLQPWLLWFEGAVILVIAFRTYRDNRNIFATLLALYVKLPLGIFFAVNIVKYFSSAKPAQRRTAGFFILFLSGLVVAVVANKREGAMPNDRLLRRHGIRQRENGDG